MHSRYCFGSSKKALRALERERPLGVKPALAAVGLNGITCPDFLQGALSLDSSSESGEGHLGIGGGEMGLDGGFEDRGYAPGLVEELSMMEPEALL